MARPPRAVLLGVTVAALVGVSACGTPNSTPGTLSTVASSTAAPAVSTRFDAQTCRETPDSGTTDRSGHDLRFDRGGIRIAVNTATQPTAPSPTSTTAGVSTCFGFNRWGPADPAVPPDSLLFVFKGDGADGAQIEFLASDLTGGVLPPIGSNRPSVGPLTGPIAAQVGVSVGDTYYHATACPLTVTALSSKRAAAHFSCPVAVRSDTNPLAPQDDVSYDTDESSATLASPAPPMIGAPSTVALSGWFELKP
ncbi:hypothetical protein AAFP30_28195 [Gordonia sp. CPCC 205515]|uniref:hypothetical protein n=1 Tax=Gordonia sp. CPCC 205515 TaxID=3140791 RepID=UPI003AF35519